jgi:hypothetical protein
MPSFSDLATRVDENIRKGLDGIIAVAPMSVSDEIVALKDATGLLALPAGYEQVGRITKEDGVTWTRDVTTSEVTSLGAASPTRIDITGDTPRITDEITIPEGWGHELFFDRAGCNQCHLGNNFTDSRFHNIGIGWDPATATFVAFVVRAVGARRVIELGAGMGDLTWWLAGAVGADDIRLLHSLGRAVRDYAVTVAGCSATGEVWNGPYRQECRHAKIPLPAGPLPRMLTHMFASPVETDIAPSGTLLGLLQRGRGDVIYSDTYGKLGRWPRKPPRPWQNGRKAKTESAVSPETCGHWS